VATRISTLEQRSAQQRAEPADDFVAAMTRRAEELDKSDELMR